MRGGCVTVWLWLWLRFAVAVAASGVRIVALTPGLYCVFVRVCAEGLRRTMFEEAERSTVLSSSPSEDARNIAIRNRIAETLRRTLQASRSYSNNNNNQDEDGDQDDAGDAGAGGPSPPRLPAPRSTGPGGAASPRYSASPTEAAGIVIPRSLSEIYQISNRNRKRNKEKKRAKDADPSGGTGCARRSSMTGNAWRGSHTVCPGGVWMFCAVLCMAVRTCSWWCQEEEVQECSRQRRR